MQSFFLLILGLSLLILGSHLLVISLKSFSLFFKLKPIFLSIVVLGFVSSSPEWFVTMTASIKNLSDVALGNIVGSNIINILLILGLTGLFYKSKNDNQIFRFDLPILLVSLVLLAVFSLDAKLSFWEACVLLGVFFAYLAVLFRKRKSVELEVLPLNLEISLFKEFRNFFLGFVVLFIGSSLAVDSSLKLVELMGLSERFAGVFILSLSTSLPELVTSMQAAYKKEKEMVLGNIVGSNLFNSLFVLGSASLIKPIYFSSELYYDYFFMILVTVVLWLSLFFFKNLPKIICAFFIISYFLYIAFVSGSLNFILTS